MLIGLQIRDVVLIEALDLSIGPGLTVLTGETGAGKSILLDALGLATGARGDAGLVRTGAAQATASAAFAPPADHPVWALLDDKGLSYARDEDLVLRRVLSADGRSRAFVNDQATGVGVLRELGAALMEVHGQHETVGLLDARTHRPLLDAYAGLDGAYARSAWEAWRAAREQVAALKDAAGRGAAEREEIAFRLEEIDRLDPREGEETELAEARAVLGGSEKALADIESARGRPRRSGPSSARASGRSPRARRPTAWPSNGWQQLQRRWIGCWWRRARPRRRSILRPRLLSSNRTGWRRRRRGCSTCAGWRASWA
jgi:DNA repair protein RecN (Recombination protein N)